MARLIGVLLAAFLAVADEAYGRQIPFAFLERMRDAFLEKFAEKGKSAAPQSLDKTFGYVTTSPWKCPTLNSTVVDLAAGQSLVIVVAKNEHGM